MGMTEDEVAALRARIEAYALDDPGDRRPFSSRLRRLTGWSAGKTRRVMAEYLRFAVLAACADEPVSPSKAVDVAWHLHLTDTRRYWEDFCPGVLGRPLHHEPGRGGAEEGARLATQYLRTLTLYERVFGAPPPADIWPTPAERRWLERVVRPAALAAPLTVAGCAAVIDSSSPGAIQGPQFILGYALLCVAGLVVMSLLQAAATRGKSAAPGELSSYELAYLAGGAPLAYAAALVRLYRAGHLVIEAQDPPSGRKRQRGQKELRPGVRLGADADPLDQAIVSAAEGGGLGRAVSFTRPLGAIKTRLQARGLWVGPGARRWVWGLWPTIMAPVIGLGLARLWFGVSGRRAVGFLVLALVLTAFLSWGMTATRAASRTAAGRRALAEARARRRDARRVLPSDPAPDLGLALFGVAARSGADMGDFLATARRYGVGVGGSGDGSSGSSCGGGSCGGGGCGG